MRNNITPTHGIIKECSLVDKLSLNEGRHSLADISLIRDSILELSVDYPNIEDWFTDKVIPGLFSGERSIIVKEVRGVLAGVAIVKHSEEESKICTVRVAPGYESRGIGPKLFMNSRALLRVGAPLVTVSHKNYDKYRRIFEYFNFQFTEKYPGLYRRDSIELSFNGRIFKKSDLRRIKEKKIA